MSIETSYLSGIYNTCPQVVKDFLPAVCLGAVAAYVVKSCFFNNPDAPYQAPLTAQPASILTPEQNEFNENDQYGHMWDPMKKAAFRKIATGVSFVAVSSLCFIFKRIYS